MNERRPKHIGVTHLLGKKSIFSKNRTEPRHDSMWNFCAAAQIEPELQRISMPRHDFGPLYWAAAWSLKNCHISIFSLENECLKARKRKELRVLTFGGWQACGCARVCDFGEIEAKIGALEEILELQLFGFLPLHLPFLSLVIYGYTLIVYLCFYIDYE